ncbi:MAG: hypothetical protein AABZ39_05915 [Spirochaetota bacterium]
MRAIVGALALVFLASSCIRTSTPYEQDIPYFLEAPRPGAPYSSSIDIAFRLSADATIFYVVKAAGSSAPSLGAFTGGAAGSAGIVSRGAFTANNTTGGVTFPHASASYEIFFAAGRDDHVSSAIQRFSLSFSAGGTSMRGWFGKGGTTTGWHTNGSGEIGVIGAAAGEFSSPSGIAVSPSGVVYVLDGGSSRVQIFSSPGMYHASFGSSGSGDGQLNNPYDIALDRDGNVFIVDTGNHRIQKFSSTGTFLMKFGANGTGDGKFNTPEGLTLDTDGNIYVADNANARIQKFTASGVFLGWWGKGSVTSGWHAPGSGETGVGGSGLGEFNSPYGVAYDPAGYIYTMELGSRRLQKFTTAGSYITEWGGSGIGDGLFDMPYGLCVDPAGYVIVVDTFNDRVQKFAPSGALVGWWGQDGTTFSGWHAPGSGQNGNFPGTGDCQFNSPRRIACDAAGNVYVVDWGNNRIQVFR